MESRRTSARRTTGNQFCRRPLRARRCGCARASATRAFRAFRLAAGRVSSARSRVSTSATAAPPVRSRRRFDASRRHSTRGSTCGGSKLRCGRCNAVLRAVGVDPAPHLAVALAIDVSDVDGAAVAVAADRDRAAVPRVAGARLDAGGDALPPVVAEAADDRPLDAGRVHRLAGVIDDLAEIGVHAEDHVGLHRLAHAVRGGGILPAEVAAAVLLGGLALIDLPQILMISSGDARAAALRAASRRPSARWRARRDRPRRHIGAAARWLAIGRLARWHVADARGHERPLGLRLGVADRPPDRQRPHRVTSDDRLARSARNRRGGRERERSTPTPASSAPAVLREPIRAAGRWIRRGGRQRQCDERKECARQPPRKPRDGAGHPVSR